MAYREPRPFMYSEKIQVFGCSAEYGNPSGHSIFAAAFNSFVFLDVFHKKNEDKEHIRKALKEETDSGFDKNPEKYVKLLELLL